MGSFKNTRLVVILVSFSIILITISVAFYTPILAKISLLGHGVKTDVAKLNSASLFTTTMKFSEHGDYQDLSHDEDSKWTDLMTPNGGFLIKIDEEGVAHRHGIGMFHQLHCLTMIRQALQKGRNRNSRPHSTYTRHGNAIGEDDGHDPELHMLHCLDYLRQSILCLADDTIEPPKKNALGRGVVDGMTVHQCRDSRSLYELSRQSPQWSRDDQPRPSGDLA